MQLKKLMGLTAFIFLLCNIALADRLAGRCLILDSLPEKTISFDQAKDALAAVSIQL